MSVDNVSAGAIRARADDCMRTVESIKRMIESRGACQISSLVGPMIETAASGAMRELHQSAFDATNIPMKDSSECSLGSSMEIAIDESSVAGKSSYGIVSFVRLEGRDMVFKFNQPLDKSSQNPYLANGISEDAILEPSILSILSATYLAGINPFVPMTYGSFQCTIVRSDKKKLTRLYGIGFYQEQIPCDRDFLLELYTESVAEFLNVLTLIACATFMCTHVVGIVHNDLHMLNVRYKELSDPRVTVAWRGRTHELNARIFPILIDWGLGCSKHVRAACSSSVAEISHYEKEARSEHDIDFGHFIRCMSVNHNGSNRAFQVFINALTDDATVDSVQSILANIIICHIVWSSWVIFRPSPPWFEYFPAIGDGDNGASMMANVYDRRAQRIYCRSIDMVDLLLSLSPMVGRQRENHVVLDPIGSAPDIGTYDDNLEVLNGNNETMLQIAVEAEDEFDVDALIKRGANVNAVTTTGDTYLHIAVRDGQNVNIIRLLMQAGADTNVHDANGETPLHIAIRNSGEFAMNALIEHGASVDATNSKGMTALHTAATFANANAVRTLLAARANPNARDRDGNTPLHIAVRAGSMMVVRELLQRGADVDMQNTKGMRAVDVAMAVNRPDLVRMFRERAAESERKTGSTSEAKLPLPPIKIARRRGATAGLPPLHPGTKRRAVADPVVGDDVVRDDDDDVIIPGTPQGAGAHHTSRPTKRQSVG